MYTNRAPGITTWMASARGNGRSILWADDVHIASTMSVLSQSKLPDKLVDIELIVNNQLCLVFLENYDFRTTLLSMLRPMDIVALVIATGSRLSRYEAAKYMIPWKQLFHDLKWVDKLEKNNCTVTLFGTSISELAKAISNWDSAYDPSRLKVMVIVGQPSKTIARQTPSWISQTTESFDTMVASYQIPIFQHILSTLSTTPLFNTLDEAQACILFVQKGSYFDLDSSWFTILSTTLGPLRLCRLGSGTLFPDSTELWRIESQRLKNVKLSDACDLVHMYQPVDPARGNRSFARVSCSIEGDTSIVVCGPESRNW